MEAIAALICRHLDEWSEFRKQGKGAHIALIVSFAVAVASYGVAAVLLVSSNNAALVAAQLSSMIGMIYLAILVFGNLQLTRLLVEVMLPTDALKILAVAQISLAMALFVLAPWIDRGSVRYVSVCLIVALIGVLAASFSLRMTMNPVQQRRDNYALVSTIASAARNVLEDVRDSPEYRKNPRMISRAVYNAAASLGCHDKKMCPRPRATY